MAHASGNHPRSNENQNNQQRHFPLLIQPSASSYDQRAYEKPRAKEIEELVAPVSSTQFIATYDSVLELDDSGLSEVTSLNDDLNYENQQQHSYIAVLRPWSEYVANRSQENGGHKHANSMPLEIRRVRHAEEPFNAIGEVAVISGAHRKQEVLGKEGRKRGGEITKKGNGIWCALVASERGSIILKSVVENVGEKGDVTRWLDGRLGWVWGFVYCCDRLRRIISKLFILDFSTSWMIFVQEEVTRLTILPLALTANTPLFFKKIYL